MNLKRIYFLSGLVGAVVVLSSFVWSPLDTFDTGPKKNFAKFLSYFEKVDAPRDINLEDLKEIVNQNMNEEQKNTISSDLLQTFIFGKVQYRFSRMGPPQITPVARFYPTENHVAVIYKSSRGFKFASAAFTLKVFNLKGKPVLLNETTTLAEQQSTLNIAFNDFKTSASFKSKPDGSFLVEEYQNVWEKDVEKFGYFENQIVGYEFKNAKTYTIKADGKIETLLVENANDRANISNVDVH